MDDLLDHPEALIEPKDHPLMLRLMVPQPTLSRWLCTGKLRGVKVGGRWYTTDACIREFVKANSTTKPASKLQKRGPVSMSRAQREAEIAADEAWLESDWDDDDDEEEGDD